MLMFQIDEEYWGDRRNKQQHIQEFPFPFRLSPFPFFPTPNDSRHIPSKGCNVSI
jgi:hypothetical protein